MNSTDAPRDSPAQGDSPWVEITAASLIALVFAAGHAILDRQPPLWDEYYHLLAARSWAADGTLSVGDGWYGRAAWFSALVGWVFRIFGEGLTQARMVTAVTQAAWVTVVFVWLRKEAGRLPAWTAAMLLATSPVVLVNSVMVRFYGVNSLLVTLSAFALYTGTRPGGTWTRRLATLAGAVALAWLANQITGLTRIWVSGLMVWAAAVALWRAARSRHRTVLLGLMAVGCISFLGVLWSTGWIADTWTVYRNAPTWAEPRATDIRWYARLLLDDYPTLWTLFPLAALLATSRKPRLGGLCSIAFGVALVLLSGAGPKSERYLLPILSFFFMVWGVAVAELIPAILEQSRRLVDQLLANTTLGWPRRVVPPLLVAGGLVFVLATNLGFTRARAWAPGQLTSVDRPRRGQGVSYGDWESLSDELGALVAEVDVVVTSNTVQMLYHVGDYDYGMRPTVIPEIEPPQEFGLDPRLGRPAIGRLESLETVVAQHGTGLIIGERWRWSHPVEGFTPDVAEFIYRSMERVPISASTGLIGYRWGPRPDVAGQDSSSP